MATYDAFALGTNPNNLTVTKNEGATFSSVTISDNLTGDGNPNILGDVSNDTFTISGSTDQFVYIGITSYTNSNGTTANGFVAKDAVTGQYYLFAVHLAATNRLLKFGASDAG
jgi:hypothetical protein